MAGSAERHTPSIVLSALLELSRFVYLSRAKAVFVPSEIERLRTTAASFNDHQGVTGLLLYNGSRFAQLVEGPEAGLTPVIDKITRDPRHEQLQIIERAAIRRRQFEGWALRVCWSFRVADDASFLSEVKGLVAHCTEPRVQAFFIGFCRYRI